MSLQTEIQECLEGEFQPRLCEVINESSSHNVPPNSETHFKVLIVSDVFDGQGLVQRHRMVNSALSAAFEKGLHALSIHAYTPDQWLERGESLPDSPPCLGGSAKEKGGK